MNAEPEVIEINQTIRMKNYALAAVLVGFCVSVGMYSVQAVGQSGSGDKNDPLAVLKQEAQAAQDKRSAEQQSVAEQQAMMRKFQAGQFDPDQQELEELEQAEGGSKKKPWWKFWARA